MKRQTLWRSLVSASLATLTQAQSTELISLNSSGANDTAACFSPSVSDDARYVVFSSSGALVAGDTNGQADIFLRDRQLGTTSRVSVDSAGAQADGASVSPDISADGRFISFQSDATNLVAGDTNGQPDIFVRDRQTGATTRVSLGPGGAQADGASTEPSISGDGRYVVFKSAATNLVAGDTNGRDDVFVHDRQTGQTSRVSISSTGTQANDRSLAAAISFDGRYVTFLSYANNLTPPPFALLATYLHDRQTGQTTVASLDWTGQPAGGCLRCCPSSDGRFIAFVSESDVLVPGDTNGNYDVFVRDRQLGTTTRISVDSGGSTSGSTHGDLSMSADGRFVAFGSEENLAPGGTVGPPDVAGPFGTPDLYVHDVQTGQTTRADVSDTDADTGAYAFHPSISFDGRHVVFESYSASLAPGDSDSAIDIYLRDRGPERITPFCAGDGSLTACPCGNNGDARHGCANSFLANGAYLGGYGTPRVGADTFLLQARFVAGNITLFYQGDAQQAPAILDDGLSCVGGAIVRLGTKANMSGVSSFPQTGDPSVSIKGAIPAGGATRYYQGWYRNISASFCPPATTNRTNGLIVVWAP